MPGAEAPGDTPTPVCRVTLLGGGVMVLIPRLTGVSGDPGSKSCLCEAWMNKTGVENQLQEKGQGEGSEQVCVLGAVFQTVPGKRGTSMERATALDRDRLCGQQTYVLISTLC